MVPVGAAESVSRPLWRIRAARTFFVIVVVCQAGLILRAYGDPHKFFGYQPFNESDTWRAEIYRVTGNGQRVRVDDRWFGYHWDELVGTSRLTNPERLPHASSGAAATIDFLGEALDWVADHTPADAETVYLEAEVTWFRNTRGPRLTVLRSEPREEAG